MSSTTTLIVTALIPLSFTGCVPLPIPHTQQVTPAVRADFRAGTGRRAAGVAVALTTSWKDTLCAQPVIQRVTDAQGHLEVPAVEERTPILWVTLMENFGYTSYYLCAGRIDSLGTRGYESRIEVHGRMAGDSLDCVTWEFAQRLHATCYNDLNPEGWLEGGRWETGSGGGTYRVLFVVVLQRPSRVITHPFVQWLVGDSIAAVAEIDRDSKPWERERLGLVAKDGRWYLTFAAPHSTFWNRLGNRWVTYELGAPGEIREMPCQ